MACVSVLVLLYLSEWLKESIKKDGRGVAMATNYITQLCMYDTQR